MCPYIRLLEKCAIEECFSLRVRAFVLALTAFDETFYLFNTILLRPQVPDGTYIYLG